MSTRDAYVARIKLQLDELHAGVTELDAKAKRARDEANAKYERHMGKLRRESEIAVAKLHELKAAGEESWVLMVSEMDRMRDQFAQSFQYFKIQL